MNRPSPLLFCLLLGLCQTTDCLAQAGSHFLRPCTSIRLAASTGPSFTNFKTPIIEGQLSPLHQRTIEGSSYQMSIQYYSKGLVGLGISMTGLSSTDIPILSQATYSTRNGGQLRNWSLGPTASYKTGRDAFRFIATAGLHYLSTRAQIFTLDEYSKMTGQSVYFSSSAELIFLPSHTIGIQLGLHGLWGNLPLRLRKFHRDGSQSSIAYKSFNSQYTVSLGLSYILRNDS